MAGRIPVSLLVVLFSFCLKEMMTYPTYYADLRSSNSSSIDPLDRTCHLVSHNTPCGHPCYLCFLFIFPPGVKLLFIVQKNIFPHYSCTLCNYWLLSCIRYSSVCFSFLCNSDSSERLIEPYNVEYFQSRFWNDFKFQMEKNEHKLHSTIYAKLQLEPVCSLFSLSSVLHPVSWAIPAWGRLSFQPWVPSHFLMEMFTSRCCWRVPVPNLLSLFLLSVLTLKGIPLSPLLLLQANGLTGSISLFPDREHSFGQVQV